MCLIIPAHQPRVCRLGGGMVRFAGCACLLVWGVVCWSGTNSVQNRFKKYTQFSSPAWSGLLPLRSVQLGARGPSASFQFNQFSSWTLPALVPSLAGALVPVAQCWLITEWQWWKTPAFSWFVREMNCAHFAKKKIWVVSNQDTRTDVTDLS